MSDLNPADYNPRDILRKGDKGYDKLKNSLEEFGEVLPIVWNKQTGNIVGGHQRYFMYVDEGRKSLEVSVVDLPLEKEKVLNITLNNHKVGGEWNQGKLATLIQELETPDLALTGFEEDDLDELLQGLDDIGSLEVDTSDFDDLGTNSLGNDSNAGNGENEGENDEEIEAEELPYEGEGDSTPPPEVFFKIGKYEFMVEKSIYSTWLQELKGSHGDDVESVIDEIQIRLGL